MTGFSSFHIYRRKRMAHIAPSMHGRGLLEDKYCRIKSLPIPNVVMTPSSNLMTYCRLGGCGWLIGSLIGFGAL